ncbi:TIGR03943 family putative permease subunit [Winogradskya consettensis]
MLLFGGAILRASIGDLYLRYVKEGLRPFLIGAGILLVAAAVMTLWYELRPPRKPSPADTDASHGQVSAPTVTAASAAALPAGAFATSTLKHDPAASDAAGQRASDSDAAGKNAAGKGAAGQGGVAVLEDADEHGHAHDHEPRIGWLLILPVLGLLLVTPPALGSYAAGQAGSVLTAQNSDSDYAALPAGDPVDVTLLDYASRAVFDAGRSLTGRHLRLTGFVTPGPDGQPMLARMVLSCCAADGRPIKVGLAGEGPAGVAADTWVQIIGTYSDKVGTDPVNNAKVPFLQVTSWQEITPPKQQYE